MRRKVYQRLTLLSESWLYFERNSHLRQTIHNSFDYRVLRKADGLWRTDLGCPLSADIVEKVGTPLPRVTKSP